MTMPVVGYEGGQLELLTKDQVHDLHVASLTVLEKIGVAVHSENALKLMDGVGAEVDYRSHVIKIPQSLVEEAIKKKPSSVTLCGRDRDLDVELTGRRVLFGGASNAKHILDLNGNHRITRMSDVAEVTRFQDALENVHVLMLPIIPEDAPQVGMNRAIYETVLKNTSKHVASNADNTDSMREQLRVAAIVSGGQEEMRKRATISFILCFQSPLKYAKENTDILIECAKLGIPVIIETDPMSGGTSPVTIAGTVIQQNAEVLCGITIGQMANSGSPQVYCLAPSILDMRTTQVAPAAPEVSLIRAAIAQLCHLYRIPLAGDGQMTGSKIPDVQAGYEKMASTMMMALAGYNLIWTGTGMLEGCLGLNYEQFLIDNEMYGMIYRILRGMDVSERGLNEALEVMGRVGPMGSHYLTQEHTREHLASEHWIPSISDRRRWEVWSKSGAKGARDVANEIARGILATHKAEPLPEAVEQELAKITLGRPVS
jgi:trimethylamine--corrinoid protein Co-methyltransferase